MKTVLVLLFLSVVFNVFGAESPEMFEFRCALKNELDCLLGRSKKIISFNKSESTRYRKRFPNCEKGSFKAFHSSGVLERETRIKGQKKKTCTIQIFNYYNSTVKECRFSLADMNFFNSMKKKRPPRQKVLERYQKNCPEKSLGLEHEKRRQKIVDIQARHKKRMDRLVAIRQVKTTRIRISSDEKKCAKGDKKSCEFFERAKKALKDLCAKPHVDCSTI